MGTVTNAELKQILTTNASTTNANFKEVKKELANKVEKETGKGLSSNDYTTAEKEKLSALPTNADLQTALNGKTTMSDVEAKGYQTATDVQTAINNASHLKKEIVQTLPAVASANELTIYMILKSAQKNGNKYDEYMLINGEFEKIGDTEVDLSGYDTAETADGKYVAKETGKGLSTNDYTTAEKEKLSALPTNADLQTALNSKTTMSDVEAKGYQTAQDVRDAINDIISDMTITPWANITVN